MENNYVFTLFENAEQFGRVCALAPFGGDVKISIPLTKRFCDRKTEELDLSVRSLNGLKREGILTLRQLSDAVMGGVGLSGVKNIGKKSISEIKTKLLVSAYRDLNDKERLEFWYKLLELNNGFFPCVNGGKEND